MTQGPAVQAFEQEIQQSVQAKYAVACNSGTSALIMACQALNVSTGDIVWTTANSFAASANCAVLLGAKVDFVDIDSDTLNISVEQLKRKLSVAERENKLPSVIIVVHFGGLPAELAEISALAKRYQFKVIEDASHAIGATYQGQAIGSCQYSDITTFSFHPVKHVTTAEGGAVTTNSEQLYQALKLSCSHGITKDNQLMQKIDSPPWYYEQQTIGFNFRLPDLLAALGTSQLKKLSKWVSYRAELAQHYQQQLDGVPVSFQKTQPSSTSAWHLFVVTLTPSLHQYRDKIFALMREKGIGVNVHYIPIYLHPFYQKLGFPKGYCPTAENYFEGAITLPLHQSLTAEQQQSVIKALTSSIEEVTEQHAS